MLRRLHPKCGTSSGGTLLTLYGDCFDRESKVKVVSFQKKGTSESICVSGRIVSSCEIECESPDVSHLAPDQVSTFSISIGSIENSIDYIVYPLIRILNLSPTYSPLSSKDIDVSLDLKYAASQLVEFPIWVNLSWSLKSGRTVSRIIKCKWSDHTSFILSPPTVASGPVKVDLSFNEQQFGLPAHDESFFHKYPNPIVEKFQPNFLPQSSDSSEIVIQGREFTSTGQIVVRLEHIGSQDKTNCVGVFLSHTKILFSTTLMIHGEYTVAVSFNNGLNFHHGRCKLVIYHPPFLLNVTPETGCVKGEALCFRLRGQRPMSLTSVPTLLVHFHAATEYESTVPGILSRDWLTVKCDSPDLSNIVDHSAGILPRIETFITINGRRIPGSSSIRVFQEPRIESLSLQHGPSTGGTLLKVHLQNGIPYSLKEIDNILIQFKNPITQTSRIVKGTVSKESPSIV